jgi:hypothetical protein
MMSMAVGNCRKIIDWNGVWWCMCLQEIPSDGVPIGFSVNKKDDLMVILLGYTLR